MYKQATVERGFICLCSGRGFDGRKEAHGQRVFAYCQYDLEELKSRRLLCQEKSRRVISVNGEVVVAVVCDYGVGMNRRWVRKVVRD